MDETRNDLIAEGCRAYMGWDPEHEVSEDVSSSEVGKGVSRILDMLQTKVVPERLTHEEAFVLRKALMGNGVEAPLRVKEKLAVITVTGGPADYDIGRDEALTLIAALRGRHVDQDDLNTAMDMLDELADLAAASEKEKELERKLETAYREIDRLEAEMDELSMPYDDQVVFGVSSYKELAEVNRRQAEMISFRFEQARTQLGNLTSGIENLAETLTWKDRELEPANLEKLGPVPEELPPR